MHTFPTTTSSAQHPPCAADPERMFPTAESVHADAPTDSERAALAVCAGCSLRAACREWALDVRLPDGVAGGMTAADRRAARRATLRPTPGRVA